MLVPSAGIKDASCRVSLASREVDSLLIMIYGTVILACLMVLITKLVRNDH